MQIDTRMIRLSETLLAGGGCYDGIDTMQVCLNGDRITDRYYTDKGSRKEYCTICGAKTIIKCPSCNKEIVGFNYINGEDGDYTDVPICCHNCGEPYPWADKINNKNGNHALVKQLDFINSVESESKRFLIKLYDLYYKKNSQIPINTVASEAEIDNSLINAIEEYLTGEGYIVRGSAHDPIGGLYIGITSIGTKKVKELIDEELKICIPQKQDDEISVNELSPDFSKITSDSNFIIILTERWKEAIICANGGANIAASVMLGSILEGALFTTAMNNQLAAKSTKSSPQNKDIEKWSLNDLIKVAIELGWIKRDRREFAEVVRDYRNLIHPKEQVKTGKTPDECHVKVSLIAVKGAINDLIDFTNTYRKV